MKLSYRFGPDVSAILLLIITIVSVGVWYVSVKAERLAESYDLNYNVSYSESYQGAIFNTSIGSVSIRFLSNTATSTIQNFVKLVESNTYDGTKFYRVIRNSYIQGGDPNTRLQDESVYGKGGTGYRISHEKNLQPIARGDVLMTSDTQQAMGGQIVFVVAPSVPGLSSTQTVFGHVVRGLDVVDAMSKVATKENNIPVTPIVIERVSLF
jgi:cyclophilin family peptidyl-prolyl cis-trans isomerase